MAVLRRACAEDVAAIERVALAAYSPYLARMGGMRPGPLDADYAAAVADHEVWVVDVDGEAVGYLVLLAEPDALLLDNVAVLPTHHGRGVGRALLELAEERAVAIGRTRIRLFTHVTMVENQRLYERVGYAETDRATEDGRTRVFYEKLLALP